MIRLYYWIPLFLSLLLLFCQGKKGGEVQLYELKIFLLQGSNQSRESSVPLFAGETSIRFIENVMKDRESLKEQLKNTFGYQQIELLEATGFTFLRSGKEQQFLLPLDERYLLRLILLPGGEENHLPLHVTLVKSSEELPLPKEEEREEWNRYFTQIGAENRLFSLRADVPLKKGIMLGKALPEDGSEALFLLVQPLKNHVSTVAELKEILQTYPRQVDIYGENAYRDFLQTVYRKLGASYPEGKTQFAFTENAGSAADSLLNVVPFAELSKRPVVKKTVQPSYPEDARRQGKEGMTVVSILVDEQGQVIREKLVKSSGSASLDSAALAAARQFRFLPGEKDGRAVKVWMKLPFAFRLKKDTSSGN